MKSLFQRAMRFLGLAKEPTVKRKAVVTAPRPFLPTQRLVPTPEAQRHSPVRASNPKRSLLAPRVEVRNPVFRPNNPHRPNELRGKSNRRKAAQRHRNFR